MNLKSLVNDSLATTGFPATSTHILSVSFQQFFSSFFILSTTECIDQDQIFSSPFTANFESDRELQQQIAVYLHQVIGSRHDQIINNLPYIMLLWGKIHLGVISD